MKPLKYINSSEKAAYMRQRQIENRAKIGTIKAEEWFLPKLTQFNLKWTRQAIWGYRLFDFWCGYLGVAVEIDGTSHNPEIDQYRDAYNLHRSAIIVLRVRNFNEEDAVRAISEIKRTSPWAERRLLAGIVGSDKKGKRKSWEQAKSLEELNIK